MSKKKIAVFSSVWNADYMYNFLQGLKQGAAERSMDLYVFNTYGDSDKDYEVFWRGEYDIFFLPDLKEFDGVIMSSNNVGIRYWVEHLLSIIHKENIPCIGIEQEMGLPHSIGIDNYRAMYEIVEYLVRDKHCKVLNYVGGPSDNEENILRKQAFCDVLKAYNIPCDPRRILDYSFNWTDGRQAYEDFKADGLIDAEAIVCANDSMAIGYLRAASEDGLNAPEDYLLTGFDNIKEAQQYSPRVTSVDRAREELGYQSICFLDDLIENRECPSKIIVPSLPIYSESTGDPDAGSSDAEFRRELFDTNYSNRILRLHLKHLRTALQGDRSVHEFADLLCHYAPQLGIHRFTIGINTQKVMENSEHDRLFYGIYDGNPFYSESLQSNSLIPDAFLGDPEECHTYLFSPCHCSGRDFGYCIVIDNFEVLLENLLSEWMLSLDNALEDLRQNLHLQIMNKKLQELYRQDPLTGLYNRFALDEKGEELLRINRTSGKSTLIIFVDMDSLKGANDIYGHDMGDKALKTIAESVSQVCSEYLSFAIRYGGDEFLMLGTYPGEDEVRQIMQRLEETISTRASINRIPFPLSASMGFTEVKSYTTDSLERHIKRADQKMYENKKRKRHLI